MLQLLYYLLLFLYSFLGFNLQQEEGITWIYKKEYSPKTEIVYTMDNEKKDKLSLTLNSF